MGKQTGEEAYPVVPFSEREKERVFIGGSLPL